MSEDATQTFAERLGQALYGFEWILFLAADVWVLVYLFPIYQRIRSRALQVLLMAVALSAFITIFDQNYMKFARPGTDDVWTYLVVREVAWYASTIMYTVGLLMFAKDYARLAGSAAVKPDVPPA